MSIPGFITPKTDWIPANAVTDGDMNRVEGNIQALSNWTENTRPHGKQLFTASGWFAVPNGVTQVIVNAVGGGGGGGGAYGANDGGDGGDGAAAWLKFITVTPGESIYIAIGGGGARGVNGVYFGANATSGASGGGTSFGSHFTVSGGGGGGAAGSESFGTNGVDRGGYPPAPYGIGGNNGHMSTQPTNGIPGFCLVEW